MKKETLFLGLLFFILASTFNSCAKEGTNVDSNLLQNPQLGVGKWKIRKPKSEFTFKKGNEGCAITEIIFRSDGVFKIYFDTSFIQGDFEITDETTILLTQESTEFGEMTDVQISNKNISFSIRLNNLCSDTLEGEKDETYNESLTYLPDDQFEQSLIDLGIDNLLDDYVSTNAIKAITELNLSNQGIKNLTGIENFTSLRRLFANYNLIESINLKKLTNLEIIDLANNRLRGYIDLSNMPSLFAVALACNNGCSQGDPNEVGIEELNISGSNNLFALAIESNDIGFLDLGQKSNLEFLNIKDNSFNGLYIAENSNLNWLNATGNPELRCILANEEQINRAIDCNDSPDNESLWCYDEAISVLTENCQEN